MEKIMKRNAVIGIVIVLSFLVSVKGNIIKSTQKETSQGEIMFQKLREEMVKDQIVKRGIKNPLVLESMSKVERHRFVPIKYHLSAYTDGPILIGMGQTISQPYIVAYMTDILNPSKTDRVLEIGTGSGYQSAILAEIVDTVYTIEIIKYLGKNAKILLANLGYKNIHLKIGDGYKGWPEEAPFDIIIVTAAPNEIPSVLVDQLANNGRMIVPVGPQHNIQYIFRITKDDKGNVNKEKLIPVRFVPMVKRK